MGDPRIRWAAVGAAAMLSLGGAGMLLADDTAPATDDVVEVMPERRTADAVDGLKQPIRLETAATSADGDELAAPQFFGTAAFVPISPYRTVDTRPLAGFPMFSGDWKTIEVISDEVGFLMVPPDAVAVSYNLTVVNTFGYGGYLTLWPSGYDQPLASSINWYQPGMTIANGGIVALGDYAGSPGHVDVYAGGWNVGTEFIIDITGYFVPAG